MDWIPIEIPSLHHVTRPNDHSYALRSSLLSMHSIPSGSSTLRTPHHSITFILIIIRRDKPGQDVPERYQEPGQATFATLPKSGVHTKSCRFQFFESSSRNIGGVKCAFVVVVQSLGKFLWDRYNRVATSCD